MRLLPTRYLYFIFLLVLFSCRQNPEKPNFVFFLIDDLGWTDLGCYGSNFYETPHIDKLAMEGVRFTSAYAACPVCSPTRASIMTGKYPAVMFTTDWFGAPQPETTKSHWTRNKPLLPAPYNEFMALDELTIAEAMKEAGYTTFFAGKWHLGNDSIYWPENQGFDYNVGGWSKGSPNRNLKMGFNGYFSPFGNPRLEDGPEGEYLPERLAKETIRFLEKHRSEPFFAFFSTYSVHTPLQTTKKLEQKYRDKKQRLGLEDEWGEIGDGNRWRLNQCHPIYAGMVEAMDKAVGSVLEKLDELGLNKNTIVIFMSDNGGLATSEGHPTTNLPLKAGKGWMYEGGIREPMIIRWPGHTKPHIENQPVISNDFYPTILEMAGLSLIPDQHTGGKSMVPLLLEQPFNRGPLFWHYPHWGNQGGSPSSAIRDGDWKLIQWHLDKSIELYNLKEDIGEKTNLAEKEPAKAAELLKKLDAWRDKENVRYPTPNPDYLGD